ncbi:hypothetical protein [Tepidiforma sp.]|uniref:hypothetical protein n=1 Tax=Tepidiforma sp. TaxID=2682230 RepID=UPI002ADD9E08|nr:hypothetical protein [Tepidiforma sp.]
MIDVEVEENRLLARASTASDRVHLRYFPGARWVHARGQFSLPRQMATYLLLRDLFGEEGWRPPASLAAEVRAALEMERPEPVGEAELTDLGDEFAVRSGFADRELVKLVPGYRWVAQEKRWRLPRVPETVRILERGFGERLRVVEEERVRRWLAEAEERIRAELARAQDVDAAPERVVADGLGGGERERAEGERRGMGRADGAGGGVHAEEVGLAGLFERLERLTVALERLVAVLENGRPADGGVEGLRAGLPPAAEGGDGVGATETGMDWREEMERIRATPDVAVRQMLEGKLSSVEGGDAAAIRFLLGFWYLANEGWLDAVRSFRRGFALGVVLEEDLEAEAKRGYQRAAERYLFGPMGGEAEDLSTATKLLARQLSHEGTPISTEALEELRTAADDLAADPELARRAPELHALARLVQFLATARRGARVDEQRLGEFIQDRNVPARIRALGMMLLANVLTQADDVSGWQMRWPRDVSLAGDFSWVAEVALEVLSKGADELGIGPFVALAALAIVAGGPREWATLDQRKQLLRFVEAANPLRGYAEFLAAFRLAASGNGKGLEREFKGYFEFLKQVPLDDSWPHLSEALSIDSGVITNRIVDEVLPAALEARGLREVETLMEAAEFAVTTQRGDNTLNRIADGVEDGSILGAEALDGEQRLRLFRWALDAARKKTHDQDADRAFVRLVRELLRQGRDAEIPNLCEECQDAFPALKERAMLAALEWALESGEEFGKWLDRLPNAFRPQSPRLDDLRALMAAFPELEEAGGEKLKRLVGWRPPDAGEARDLAGRTVLVVGGHPSLMTKAMPQLGELGLQPEWLDADSAKQGGRAVGRAQGSVDLVVVNVAYIGHAASERVVEAAKSAGNRYLARAFTGPRMLVSTVRQALSAADEDREGVRSGKGGRRR